MVIMNDVILLPKVGHDAVDNRNKLLMHYQSLSPFVNADWKEQSWNAKGICKVGTRQANKDVKLHFTRDNRLGNKVKVAADAMQPFHSNELNDIAKSHVCQLQITSAKAAGTLQNTINAYRYLDNELHNNQLRVEQLSNRNFVDALNAALNKLGVSTTYRVGVQLNTIAKFMDKYKLTKAKIKFKSTIKRGDTQTASDSRIDTESITERNDKLPTHEVLVAVAALSNLELTGSDSLHQAITDILFTTGLRFDEVPSLSVDCFNLKKGEKFCEMLGRYEKEEYWELKYHARKGGAYRTKAIPESLVPILKKAIEFVTEYFLENRDLIAKIENNKNNEIYDFFPEVDGICFVTDTWQHFGTCNGNAQTYLKKHGVTIIDKKRPNATKTKVVTRRAFNADELKDVIYQQAKNSIAELWKEIKEQTTATRLSELLFIQQYQAGHSIKSTTRWQFTPVTHTQYQDFLLGREVDGKSNRIPSIFERKKLKVDGVDFHLTSHQFRHFLNTVCQLSDSISELEIARYFGRKYQNDNETYDHTNKTKLVMDEAQAIIDSHGLDKQQAKDVMNQFAIVDREEVLEAIEELASSLKTAIGLCKHNFADEPCGKHYSCLRGCSQYKRTKGNQSEIAHIIQVKNDTFERIEAAKEAVSEEYWGANNWLLSHQTLYDGCIKALAIEDNDMPNGKIIQVFPEGNDGCKEL